MVHIYSHHIEIKLIWIWKAQTTKSVSISTGQNLNKMKCVVQTGKGGALIKNASDMIPMVAKMFQILQWSEFFFWGHETILTFFWLLNDVKV